MNVAGSFLKIQDQKEKIKHLDKLVDQIHFDIMDGVFVPNKTASFEVMKDINKGITKPKDIHLMVKDIQKYIDIYKTLNPDYIIFHYEAADDILKIINKIKSLNIKCGIAINPDTDVKVLEGYLDKIDLVLIMSVFPGAGGQKYIDISDKINYLKEIKTKTNLDFKIEVDGGINNTNIKLLKNADTIVVGSYITDNIDYQKQIEIIRGEL